MDAIFLGVLNISITATYLILAVLLLRLLLKKAPKWITCVLWGIVALRLIMPFSIESEISLVPSSQTITATQSENIQYEINTGIDTFDKTINQIIIQDAPTNTLTPPITDNTPNDVPTDVEQNQNQKQNNDKLSLFDILFIVWVIGIAVMLIFSAVSYIKIYKNVCPSIVYRDNIYYCDNIDSPFILGIIKPKIYVPSGIDENSLNFVIEHENAHLKRRDHLWKPFGFLLLAIYWFNPFLWLSYILLCRDIESACDEKVIKDMSNEDKKGYSTALLNCSVHRRMITACPVAFGEVGVKERIKSVLNYKKPAFWIIAVAIVTSIAVAVCFLTNPKKKEKVDLSFLPLEFSVSGNGAWHESITIKPDGTFNGKYTDWNADSGEDYVGMYHICEFSGKFKDIKVNDDYSYSLTLEKFESKYKDKEEWIEDGTKYVATDSLEDFAVGEKFLLYKLEAPISSIDESALIDYPYNKNTKTLSCYMLYASKTNRGLFSKEISNENESQILSDYNNLMNNFYNQNPDFYYAVKDIDGNSVKELIILSNTTITVYTHEQDVKQLDSYDFVTGTVRMFSSDDKKYPGIFYFTVGGGCDHYSYLTLSGDNIVTTKLCEYYYSADEPYWVDISDDKEMIAEAKALYNANKDIIFLDFEPITNTKNFATFVNGAKWYTATVLFDEANLSAKSLVITDLDTNKEIQKISLNRSEEVTTTDKNIYALDVNFDGYCDLLIPDMHPARAIFFSAFIYDSAQQKFVEAPSFKDLPNIALDTENRQILYSSGGDSMFNYGMACYKQDKKDFVTTNSIFIEPNHTDGTTEFTEYHFEECRYEDGKEIIVNEFNIPLHEFYLYPVAYPDILPYYQEGSFWDLDSDKWDGLFKNENGVICIDDDNIVRLNFSLEEIKTIFEPLLSKAIEVEQTIINDAATFEYEDKIAFRQNNSDYSLITDKDFQSLEAVWNYAYTAFTPEAAQRAFKHMLDQSLAPRFLEKDGKLYYNRNAHSYKSEFDMESIEIVDQLEDSIIVGIKNYGYNKDNPDTCFFIMTNTQNGWRLATTETESYNDIDITDYINSSKDNNNLSAANRDIFEKILNNEQSFYSTNKKADVILSDYNKKAWKYSYVDMDNDNIDELAIELESGDVLILKIDGESIIGFEFSMRAMYQINTDGSFLWNENTGNTYGCSRLKFTGKTYKDIELWRVENSESGSTTYYIDGKTATKEEVDSLIVPPSINWNDLSTTS